MRLSRWLASVTKLSRRKADQAIKAGRVSVNGELADIGQQVSSEAEITLDGNPVQNKETTVLLLNKPVGYICSKVAQDEKPTIYELLPEKLLHLTYVGRLDADSEGLVIMTNDGKLTQKLTHPRFEVSRTYHVTLNKQLTKAHSEQLVNEGVELSDGISSFDELKLEDGVIKVTLHEGRNRQIRRSFDHLGYQVELLRRVCHGPYALGDIESGKYSIVDIYTE